MTFFVDASALVAIIADEPERGWLEERLAGSTTNYWSAMTEWETVSALVSSYRRPIGEAREKVGSAASIIGLMMVPIDEGVSSMALTAYEHYGRRSGHRAKLNMGDCFAYGCAKIAGAALLYKGDDFVHTDLA